MVSGIAAFLQFEPHPTDTCDVVFPGYPDGIHMHNCTLQVEVCHLAQITSPHGSHGQHGQNKKDHASCAAKLNAPANMKKLSHRSRFRGLHLHAVVAQHEGPLQDLADQNK